MHISSIRIKNYKSYLDSGVAVLESGRNLILGRNSVGKTSLAEMLTGTFQDIPHKSLKTLPQRGAIYDHQSTLEIEFVITSEEIYHFMGSFKNHIWLPNQSGHNDFNVSESITNLFNENSTHILKCIIRNSIIEINIIGLEGFKSDSSNNQAQDCVLLNFRNNEKTFKSIGSGNQSPHNTIWNHLYKYLITKIYCFKAERYNLAKSAFGMRLNLDTNASNLPEVLNVLQSTNPNKFERYNKYVNFIFPEIRRITIRPIDNNQVEILIWTIDISTERDDLAISLSLCGTGYGQILAMLYVVLESESKTIIIDEPQSFLHPGAAKKLMEILKENKQHQYVLTTHSSTIVSSSNPQTITLIKNTNSESKFETLKRGDSDDIKNYLAEIGSRLSDVFGADNILWVEGATEEQCFPIIMDSFGISSKGANIVGIINTGDIEGKFKKTVFEAYEKLSKGNSLMPPAIGFIFDKEGRTKVEIEDLERQSKDKVKFLSRKMYENYLLNSKAITSLINQIEDFSDSVILEQTVIDWMENNKDKKEYWKGSRYKVENWKHDIHAGKFLSTMFKKLSESKVEYRKTTHSVKLTQIIIQENPDELKDITELIKDFIK